MPIKVGDGAQFDPGRPTQIGPGTSGPQVDAAAFKQQLAYHSNQEQADSLERLVGDVDAQAKRLLNNPSMSELAGYRDQLSKFMKAVSAKLGKLEKRTDRRNRTLVILQSLDQKLEDLTKAVLDDQEKGLDLLERLNEIRGMLLDLLI